MVVALLITEKGKDAPTRFDANLDPKTGNFRPPEETRYVADGGRRYMDHAAIGKVSFALEALETNFAALMDQIVRSKPASSKGVYVKNVSVSSTMGPGVRVDTTPYR